MSDKYQLSSSEKWVIIYDHEQQQQIRVAADEPADAVSHIAAALSFYCLLIALAVQLRTYHILIKLPLQNTPSYQAPIWMNPQYLAVFHIPRKGVARVSGI